MSRRLEKNILAVWKKNNKTNYCINLPKKTAQGNLYVWRCFFWQMYAIICLIYYIGNFL